MSLSTITRTEELRCGTQYVCAHVSAKTQSSCDSHSSTQMPTASREKGGHPKSSNHKRRTVSTFPLHNSTMPSCSRCTTMPAGQKQCPHKQSRHHVLLQFGSQAWFDGLLPTRPYRNVCHICAGIDSDASLIDVPTPYSERVNFGVKSITYISR